MVRSEAVLRKITQKPERKLMIPIPQIDTLKAIRTFLGIIKTRNHNLSKNKLDSEKDKLIRIIQSGNQKVCSIADLQLKE